MHSRWQSRFLIGAGVFCIPVLGITAINPMSHAQCIGAWTEFNNANNPGNRSGHAMAFDMTRGNVVLWGGTEVTTGQKKRDMWQWNGSAWTQISAGNGPAARDGHAMATDSIRNKVILFGGVDTSVRGDTWQWDGQAWTQVSSTGPSARNLHAMCFDSDRGVMVLFGGSGQNSDTWEWNGTTWTRVATVGPAPRSMHQMVYDRFRRKTVLFGGALNAGGVANNETWEWNGQAWTMISNQGPIARARATLTFDETRGVTVLFGGYAAGGLIFNDTWDWDGANWNFRAVPGPSGRYGHQTSWDPARNKVVLYGSLNTYSELWEWAGGSPVTFTQQPVNVSAVVGTDAVFTLTAPGAGRTYQWRRNGVPLTESAHFVGTRTNTLRVVGTVGSDHGSCFDCVVSSDCDTKRSDPASLVIRANCAADVDDGFNTGQPDGGVTIEDLIYFLRIFESGC